LSRHRSSIALGSAADQTKRERQIALALRCSCWFVKLWMVRRQAPGPNRTGSPECATPPADNSTGYVLHALYLVFKEPTRRPHRASAE